MPGRMDQELHRAVTGPQTYAVYAVKTVEDVFYNITLPDCVLPVDFSHFLVMLQKMRYFCSIMLIDCT